MNLLRTHRFWLCLALGIALIAFKTQATQTNQLPIDLPTALRLAGAQNLDVKIAREKLTEAKANHASAVNRFFPWLSPGITYRQHDDKIQDVEGNIIEVHKYSYSPGATVAMQLDLGDAIYNSLATKQLANATSHALEVQRQDSSLAAVEGYFDLVFAQSAVRVAQESVRISGDYEKQLAGAVDAGIAFKGDLLRARVQSEKNQLLLRQSQEQQRIAAAKLAQILRLDPEIELVAQESELTPLSLIATNAALDSLVQSALATRPELKQNASLVSASREEKHGAKYGPLIPSIGGQGFWGGLGGGRSGVPDTFGGQSDYSIGLGWRLGPGGLFDSGKIRSAESRLKIAELNKEKLRDEVTRQVIEAFTRWQSLGDQLRGVERALAAAEEGLQLAKQRKEFAVGIVLEAIQSEQDFTRGRLDYLKTVTDFNKAQFLLNWSIGKR